jgi:DNA-binding NtrC family response regulator
MATTDSTGPAPPWGVAVHQGRIVIVDDDPRVLTALCRTLPERGYETQGYATGAEALAALRQTEVDVLLSDLMMPEMDGTTLLRAALEIAPDLIGIIMTGHGTIQSAVQAMRIGAYDYVLKPVALSALLPCCRGPWRSASYAPKICSCALPWPCIN